jgi:uncharacterized phage protein gp47/JayE
MAFDYTSRDFDTIKSDLLARASRVLPEWTDRDPSDFGMLLVDLWAHAADVLHFYVDRAAGEAFLDTAQQRESVLAMANLFDYTPRGRTSAEATLTLSNLNGTPYVVPPFTQFLARYDNQTFQVYTSDGGLIPANDVGTVTVREGELITDEVLTSSSPGTGNQRYTLVSTDVVPSSVRVFVFEDGINPLEYQRVQRISSADTGDRVFATAITADGATEVVFGSILNGFVPPPGAKITATYSDSSGSAGNLPADSVTGWRAATPPGLLVDSCSSFTGGSDEESISSLKRSIPSVISAQNRAVTRNDFIRLAAQVEGVAKATIEYAPGTGGNNASVTVYPHPFRADYLTTSDTSYTVPATMQSAVINALQPKSLLGVDVLCADEIEYDDVRLTATVHVNERFVTNWVEADVNAALDELFQFDNVHFGQRMTVGQVYRIVLNVPGVDYCTISVFTPTLLDQVDQTFVVDPLHLPKAGTRTLTMVGGISTS